MAARKAKKEEGPRVFRYTIDGDSYDLELSIEKIPLRDRIAFEEYMEMPWTAAMGSEWFFSEKVQAFLAYLAMRRRRKTATLDDVLNTGRLTMEEVKPDPKRPTKTPETSGPQS
jgi:hypothetical protein